MTRKEVAAIDTKLKFEQHLRTGHGLLMLIHIAYRNLHTSLTLHTAGTFYVIASQRYEQLDRRFGGKISNVIWVEKESRSARHLGSLGVRGTQYSRLHR